MWSSAAKSHSSDVITLYKNAFISDGGEKIDGVQSVVSGTQTISFNLEQDQTTFTPLILFAPHNAEFQIARIRIA